MVGKVEVGKDSSVLVDQWNQYVCWGISARTFLDGYANMIMRRRAEMGIYICNPPKY